MLKMALILAATAVPAFGAGILTASTMAGPRPAEATVISPTTISPYDMQLNVKPHDLPVQYMQGDFNTSAFVTQTAGVAPHGGNLCAHE